MMLRWDIKKITIITVSCIGLAVIGLGVWGLWGTGPGEGKRSRFDPFTLPSPIFKEPQTPPAPPTAPAGPVVPAPDEEIETVQATQGQKETSPLDFRIGPSGPPSSPVQNGNVPGIAIPQIFSGSPSSPIFPGKTSSTSPNLPGVPNSSSNNSGGGTAPTTGSTASSALNIPQSANTGGGSPPGIETSRMPLPPGSGGIGSGGGDAPPASGDGTVDPALVVAKTGIPAGSDLGYSPGGTVGSKPESVVLPGFEAVYLTLPLQPIAFDTKALRTLDLNVRLLSQDNEQYLEYGAFRKYSENYFLPGTEPDPLGDGCSQVTESDRIKVTCTGLSPAMDKEVLRLVSCGVPDENVLTRVTGYSSEHPEEYVKSLGAFLQKVWIQGQTDLWKEPLCPEGRVVDYTFDYATFSGSGEVQIVFPLEFGKVYFLTQKPRDYEQNKEYYMPENPNDLGHHTNTFLTKSGLLDGTPIIPEGTYRLNYYLFNSRIAQVVLALEPNSPKIPPTRVGTTGNKFSIIIGSEDTSAATQAAAAIEIPNNAYCQAVTTWVPQNSQFENELLTLINQRRDQGMDCGSEGSFGKASALQVNPILHCAARKHSLDMALNDFFSHINLDGQSQFDRILLASSGQSGTPSDSTWGNLSQAGGVFANTGENIGKGQSDANAILNEWLQSDAHCANLMSSNFTHIGVGYVPGTDGQNLWTIDFGKF